MNKESKIYVAGHLGLVGTAIMQHLYKENYKNVITSNINLTNQQDTEEFFRKNKPEYIFLIAGKVGGIGYNKEFPGDILSDNILIQTNVIRSSVKFNVKKLLFVASASVYPQTKVPLLNENMIFSGELEKNYQAYGFSKQIGIMLCQKYNEQYNTNFISICPNSLYGPYDRFNLKTAHVVPALITKIYNAKINNESEFICWGDGTPVREFIFSYDLADCCEFLMNNYDESEPINIGVEKEISIKDLIEIIKNKIEYNGEICWDKSKPNGILRRKLDISKLNKLGWKPKYSLEEGLEITIKWYLENCL